MAAESQTRPADLAAGQNCPLPGAREPSSNGRSACAPAPGNGVPVGASGDRIRRALEDDAAWLQRIIDRYEGPLVRYAARITGDIDRGRDVAQETFLRLCREPEMVASDHLAQWLFTVCRRLALDVRRKETRMKTGEAAGVCDLPSPAATLSCMEETEDASQVLRLLAALPANQQEVVRLKFQEGMSYKAIAGITGLSVTNVGYLLHTAVKTLRERMEELNRG